jgi:hypothetical protein
MSDLTAAEQTHVRTALKFLRSRCGTWETVAKILRLAAATLNGAATGRRTVSPLIAFRVARLAKVSVDDVLTGHFPAPGTCPHCGHKAEAAE